MEKEHLYDLYFKLICYYFYLSKMIEHMPGLKYEFDKYDKCCGFLSFIDKNHDIR